MLRTEILNIRECVHSVAKNINNDFVFSARWRGDIKFKNETFEPGMENNSSGVYHNFIQKYQPLVCNELHHEIIWVFSPPKS